MSALGFYEALGNHFIFDTISVMAQDIAFYQFFGTSVATDFCLSVLYDRVIVSSAKYEILYEYIPLSFVALQVIVNLYLVSQVRNLIKFFENNAKLLKNFNEETRLEHYKATKRLERRFSFWVPVSVFCATISAMMWILWFKEIMNETKELWIVLWSLMSISKIGNVWAQVEVCVPPERQGRNTISIKKSHLEDTEKIIKGVDENNTSRKKSISSTPVKEETILNLS
eukprot:snap_masked-scaffold_71-processed-gene-0.44-mRNA-1 protein AED:1.00 eAED:1.00 QI:0/0/0/0/1/1/2/0/226